jgi:hypothetical protein
MKDTKTDSKNKSASATVEVLYQKMGNRWFAFSLVNNEVFVGSITQQEIDALEAGTLGGAAPVHKLVGNS